VPVAALSAVPAARYPAERDPLHVYLRRLGERSRRVMGVALERQARLLTGGRRGAAEVDWSLVDYQHTAALRAALQEAWIDDHGDAQKLAPATIKLYLAALRGVLRECWRLGHTDAETYRRAADIAPVRGETAPRGRALSADEIRALFAVCRRDPAPAGRRDAALLAVLYGAGLRRSEASGLDVRDYAPATGALQVRHGKGDKARLVYLAGAGATALADWLALRGMRPGPLFLRLDNQGAILWERTIRTGDAVRTLPARLSAQGLFFILRRRGRAANLEPFSPHDLRRTFISDLLDAGADISATQRLAGHAQVTTTQRYDRRGEESKRKAAALIQVPYHRAGPAELYPPVRPRLVDAGVVAPRGCAGPHPRHDHPPRTRVGHPARNIVRGRPLSGRPSQRTPGRDHSACPTRCDGAWLCVMTSSGGSCR